MHWPISKLATLLLSAVPTAALAFQPISGPVSTRSAAPANVVLLLDNSSSMVLNSTGCQPAAAPASRPAIWPVCF